MKIIVLTTDNLKSELLAQVSDSIHDIIYVDDPMALGMHTDADVLIDLLFDSRDNKEIENFTEALIIVNSVNNPYQSLPDNFIKINGWPTFLGRDTVEASGHPLLHKKAETILSVFNKKTKWLNEKQPFISSRIVSMIINEAFLAIEESVSTKEEIDIAMKTGTNYPFGPFEWAKKIGFENIHLFLYNMSRKDKRYIPSVLLTKEAGK